jgi:hypothetical protein
MNDITNQFSELLSSPLGELISSIGKGVGEAQAALDEGSLKQTLDVYKLDESKPVEEQQRLKLLREIGYQPTFYVIPETEVEAQVSLSLNINNSVQSNIQGVNRSKFQAMAIPLNAGNINRYNLNASAAAKIKFTIVPVPPNSAIADMRVVPNLIGLKFKDAKILLESLALNHSLPVNSIESEIQDSIITKTVSAANVIVKIGNVIAISF